VTKRPLLILHLDGVGHDTLKQAIADRVMPFAGSLLENGYRATPYMCGLPSTTPYAQAGILYGDNSDIAGFRWYDKQSGAVVAFGIASSFKRVAHRYLGQGHGLLENGGAAIAACYDGGAERTFGLSFKERRHGGGDSATPVVLGYLANPLNLADVGWHLLYASGVTLGHFAVRRLSGQRPALTYTVADIAEEIFVHHLTRYAVLRAMKERRSPIYAGFYAYDETAHAFGPDDRFSEHMLRHVDHTLEVLFKAGADYEIVVLSDHGQTPCVAFSALAGGRRLHEVVGELAPRYEVRDAKGKKSGPKEEQMDGHIVVAASGGLAHLFLAESTGPLELDEVDRRCPGLAAGLAQHIGVHFVLGRGPRGCILIDCDGSRPLDDAGSILAAFDDASTLRHQLQRLASFRTAGDLILVGKFEDGRQVDFEDQRGAHGSLGGEQCHPFLLARAALGLGIDRVTDARQLHEILRELIP
jgi:Type I phosphodiesterase / nucleotide pyrophosphatase